MTGSNQISCILIDDDQLVIDQFQRELEQNENFQLEGCFSDSDEFKLAALRKNPDILFLDIEMPEKSGLQLGKELNELNLKSEIVFTTGYRNYAFHAINIRPFAYLEKPINQKDLNDLAIRILANGTKETSNEIERIAFNTTNGILLLNPNDIMCIQADGNYSQVIMRNGKKHLLTCTLKKIGKSLEGSKLRRVGRSFIFNLNSISYIDRKNLTCTLEWPDDRIEIPVSRAVIRKLVMLVGESVASVE